VTCQISTASVSLVASSIVAIMVARSKTSIRSTGGNNNNRTARRIRSATTPTFALVSSPYHRIIFGLSISDIFQSFGLLSGPFAAPAYVPQALWGAGNNLSCATNGVISTIGIISTPMYTFFLCYFCLCKVKKNMTDDTFSQKIEWKLHKFIIAFNFMICVAALATKSLNSNPNGNICTTAAVPTGCRQSPDIYGECDETIARNTTILTFVIYCGASLLCLVGIITCMVKICWHVMITTHTSTRKRTGVRGSSQDGHTRKSFTEAARRNFLKDESTTRAAAAQRTTVIKVVKNNFAVDDEECTGREIEPAQKTLVGSQTYQDGCSANALVKVYRREFVIQASLYVLVYIAQNFFVLYSMIVFVIEKRHLNNVFVLLASIFYPLGGLFNILVYTRPKVLSLRRMHPQYYWFQAFVIVIRAGAVVPMVVVEEENSPPARESPAGQSSLSTGGMMLRNLSSIETPPVILGNALLSGDYSEESDDCDRIVERKYYGNLRLDSSPSILANALSPATDESNNSTSAGEGERSYLSLFSGMDAIAEESDEEE
jgi:hypothetical protein